MEEKTYQIEVTGKVQGVFFRKHTREKAIELGLKGFVENRNDGSVYIKASGPETEISKLVEWCKKGSPNAVVKNVHYTTSNRTNTFSSFEIKK